eukprot:8136544-Alexandrium_andersonii.AAC.1
MEKAMDGGRGGDGTEAWLCWRCLSSCREGLFPALHFMPGSNEGAHARRQQSTSSGAAGQHHN